jgi:hypothetical protein
MSLATITFWDENLNAYGIPNTYYSYLVSVFVNQVVGNGDKLIKIVPLTDQSPKPASDRPFILRNSSWDSAISQAFNILNEMPTLQGFKSHKSIIWNKEKSIQFIQN